MLSLVLWVDQTRQVMCQIYLKYYVQGIPVAGVAVNWACHPVADPAVVPDGCCWWVATLPGTVPCWKHVYLLARTDETGPQIRFPTLFHGCSE